MTLNNLKLLPKQKKKVLAKILQEQGFSSHQLEKWLDLSHATIWRAKVQPTPEKMRQFETEMRNYLDTLKKRGIILGYNRLVELVTKERKIDQLVKGLDKLEGKENNTNTIQIANIIEVDRQKYE